MIKIFPLFFLIAACGGTGPKPEPPEGTVQARTPVTLTNASFGPLEETIDLNATTAFQKKDIVKAEISGYLQEAHVNVGDMVEKGQTLFVLQTRESAAFQDQTKLDSALRFSGILTVRAPIGGIVTDLGRLKGDYAQEGDQLCVIAERNSFVFLVNVPFSERQTVHPGSTCTILLPDNTKVQGTVTVRMPAVDQAAQAEVFAVKPQKPVLLPENLIARTLFVHQAKPKAQTLPKEAVLTNETQQRFWVMKLINDSLAIKIPVTKGMETDRTVEIVSPVFAPGDRILRTGNYGLKDTASVLITTEEQ